MSEIPEPAPTGLQLLFALATAAGGQFVDGTMQLPASVGTGSLKILALEPGLKVAINQCTLAQEIVLKRLPDTTQPELLLISFNAFDPAPKNSMHLSSVQITSSDIAFTTTLPAHTAIFMVAIAIQKQLLTSWLQADDGPLPGLLTTRHSVVLDTLLTPEIQMVMVQLAESRPPHTLDSFFYKIKIQELLYFLFRELASRAETPPRHLHPADVDKIMQVRTALLSTLSAPPSLAELAQTAGFSETKMKQLFRQVFGTSPYTYFQTARMEEARRQLQQLSVSEVGYRLGFSNLSHFARLFEKQHGLTPKKYQATHLR